MEKLEMSTAVQQFFDEYEKGVNEQGAEFIMKFYGGSIMISTLRGAYSFTNDDFARMLPKRKEFFDTTGLKSSSIVSMCELDQSENFPIVKVIWKFHFEKMPSKPIDLQAETTYVLQKYSDGLKIICQIDHQDLVEEIKKIE